MREKLLWVIILSLFITKTISAQNPNFSIGQNFRIFPDTVVQVETKIATHPLNPSIMACCAVTDVYPGGYTTGAYISTNAGINWTGTQAIKTQQNQIIVTVGNPSIVIDKNGNFIICYIAANNKIGVSYSSNSGQFWTPISLPGVDTADKCISVTDDSPSSPYFGSSYIVYSERRGVYFSATSNGGANWSVATRVSPPAYNSRIGASIAVGVSGEIYVIWPYLPQTNDYIGFAKSTDGGLTWNASDTSIPVDPLPFDFRVNLNLVKLNGLPVIDVDKSGSDRNGFLYIAASEKKASGNPALDNCDIVLHASSNNGASWDIMHRVHQSDSLNLSYQLFPALSIDNYGGVNVTYIDTRNTAANDSFQVYLSHSENGGTTFQDLVISDHKFKLKQLPVEKKLFGVPGYIGTAIGSSISNNKIFSFWF
ncbi:MAG: sialidase family protein, partial [bacterium]